MSTTRDNSGTFSANKRKEKETHPDIKGKATIAGVEYWISGWRKDSGDGIWYSLAFEPKDVPAAAPAPAGRGKAPLDDDIPFAAEWR